MKAKRTIAGVLAFTTLVAAAVSIGASAADATVTLSASNEVVSAAGDSFTVEVSLTDIPSTKVNVLDFALTYDSSVLTISDVSIGDSANTDTSGDTTTTEVPVFDANILDGEIDVTWSTGLTSDAWISTDGVILTITGTVNSGVADGTVTPIDFAAVSRETYDGSGEANSSILVGYVYGTDYAEYNVETESGSVTVGTSSSTTTTTTTDGGQGSTTTTTTQGGDTTISSDGTTASTTKATTTSTTVTASPDASLVGDVNLDGNVTLADVVVLNKVVAGAVDLNGKAKANANCNGDELNSIDASDSLALLKFLVQLVDMLPYAG
ncbi:MAG: hypothetical protein LUF89_10530 [Ruminococcus sp.]|nr:hypothetical protein [Ruminococcus sp.]